MKIENCFVMFYKKIKQESHKIETFKGELVGFGNSNYRKYRNYLAV